MTTKFNRISLMHILITVLYFYYRRRWCKIAILWDAEAIRHQSANTAECGPQPKISPPSSLFLCPRKVCGQNIYNIPIHNFHVYVPLKTLKTGYVESMQCNLRWDFVRHDQYSAVKQCLTTMKNCSVHTPPCAICIKLDWKS